VLRLHEETLPPRPTHAYTATSATLGAGTARARTLFADLRDEVPEPPSLARGTPAALHVTTMTITMGQLVSDLYAKYERELHDEELAAVATEIKVAELLETMPRRRARPRKR
jgi:hypothetical protein